MIAVYFCPEFLIKGAAARWEETLSRVYKETEKTKKGTGVLSPVL